MGNINFGELKRLDLRTIWNNEAINFTPWLAENIDILGKEIGMDLQLVDQEAPVGGFALDILATDSGTGRTVIIENQFGKTDHDHLGKVITYASGYNAYAVIWVAETIREEHRQALDWLNQRTDENSLFFGIVVELIQIDESQPAYSFRLVVFPNEWQKKSRLRSSKAPSKKVEAYREFFQLLIDTLREEHQFTGARIAQLQNWYSFASGFSGISYGANFPQGGKARVEIYFDQGDTQSNEQLFEHLYAMRSEIEKQFGSPLDWERLDDRKASRIAIYRQGSIEESQSNLEIIREWMIKNLLKFKQMFTPELKNYFS
jgi:hypothetical protein